LVTNALNVISSLESEFDEFTEQLLTGYFGFDFANDNSPEISNILRKLFSDLEVPKSG
jgi:hypothetical protein